MKNFMVRENDDDPWLPIEATFGAEAAESFAEDQGLEHGAVVEVKDDSKYAIVRLDQPEYSAYKVTT